MATDRLGLNVAVGNCAVVLSGLDSLISGGLGGLVSDGLRSLISGRLDPLIHRGVGLGRVGL